MAQSRVVADESPGEFGLRVGEDIERFALFDDGPVVDDSDMRANGFDYVHLVCDDDDSQVQLPIEPFDQFENCLGGVRIERAGRFIQQQDSRIVGERTGDGDTLLLPSGQL